MNWAGGGNPPSGTQPQTQTQNARGHTEYPGGGKELLKKYC